MKTAVVLAIFLTAAAARADSPPTVELNKVGIDQRLNETVPLDLIFRDEVGHAVRLGDYFQGRPVILVLAYYRCPMLCTQVLNGLTDALRGVPLQMGSDFQVVTVSFDAREQPELAAAKKASYVAGYGRLGAADGWHFLTGEQAAIDRLARAVGFRYQYDARLDQFAHASGVTVLTPDGKIARYFFGLNYPPRDLRLTLVEASAGKIGSPVDRVLLLCYHYDPATGKYTPAVMNLVRFGGGLTLAVLALLFGRAWFHRRRVEPATVR
jgi:protein SCO1/2